jgi:hypothetical protein
MNYIKFKMDTTIKFNNTNFGDIDKFIAEKFINDNRDLYKLRLKSENKNLYVNVFKYKNDFPLILDEIKKYFPVYKTNYAIVNIEGEKYLAYKSTNSIPLKEYLEHTNIERSTKKRDIQRIFIFNYIMCVNSNFENKIYVFPYDENDILVDIRYCDCIMLKCVNEKSFKQDSSNEISKRILKEFFDGSIENFYKLAYEMVKGIDNDKLKWELEKIVSKYDDNYVYWINAVYIKFQEIKNLYRKSF